MLTSLTRTRAVAGALVASSALLLASCGEGGTSLGVPGEPAKLATDGPEVLADQDGTGVEVSRRLFDSSDAVVVASTRREDQLTAADVAASLGAPMLVRQPGAEAAVDEEIQRLGAERVVEVPGDDQAVADAAPVASESAETDVAGIAGLDPAHPVDLVLPPVLATPTTSLPAAATARAAGAQLQVLGTPDPRLTQESTRTVTEQDTIALGEQWGTTQDYAHLVQLANNGELPGGGGLVFPGRRMIALYGHPFAPELGVMGEQDPAAAAQMAKDYAAKYQPMEDQPVIPAFEIIVTVASEFPGEDGDYSNEAEVSDAAPWIDAITEAGGYAVLDLQPGQGNFLSQVQRYEELLKRPNVGLALDAEWKLNPGEQPLSRVGSATAAEINEVADWLAQLTRDNHLPQKAFVLHQFQVGMFPDRENISTAHPELAYVLHADGHGSAEQKFDTWNVLREGLDPKFFMAWKNFLDEDMPMFTPEQTYNEVQPRPWFVSYQ